MRLPCLLLLCAACGPDEKARDSAPPVELPEPTDSGDGCLPEELACDGIDDDCDGEVDEGLLTTVYADEDGDGVGGDRAEQRCPIAEEGWVARTGDCDDADPERTPDAVELCNDQDDDCDGEIDEDLSPPTWYPDADGDGHGDPSAPVSACAAPEGTVPRAGDCDDSDPTVHPLAAERCDDGVDDDCDGVVDEVSACCISTTPGTDRYVLCTEPAAWETARDRCAEDGAQLVVIADAAEDAWVDEVVTWLGDHVWIGVSDLAEEGRWLTVAGTAPPHQDWRDGQPNGGEAEDCVGVSATWHQWFDGDCATELAYLCSLPPDG